MCKQTTFWGCSLKKSLTFMLVAILLAVGAWTPTAKAASAAQIAAAIQAGLAHLVGLQAGDGSWNYEGYTQAPTGAAIFALLSSKADWPAAQVAAYNTAVANGIAYLLAHASKNTVSTRNDGVNMCPGGGTCTGVYWDGNGEATYSTGIVTGAIDSYGLTLGAGAVATGSGALAGMTWGQIAQGVTNEFATSQSSSINNNLNGGWRYYLPGNGDSDSSTTQWAVYSFIFDEALGAVTPAAVKTNLQVWLAAVQEPSGSGAATGGVCYYPVALGCSIGPTVSDTGGWLLANQWVGTAPSSASIQAAMSWLNTNWQTNGSTSGGWLGNFDQPYAMLAAYKGLESTIGTGATTNITNLLSPTCGGNVTSPAVCNWYQDYEQWLVTNQNTTTGAWAGSQDWTDPLSTAFDLSIMSAAAIPVAPPPVTTVPVLSAVGIGVLALLLALGGFMMIRTRRAHTS